jgi:ABC-type transport system involved in multi-copper enzyme maturation permease subunit
MTSHRSTCLNPFCGTRVPHRATQCPKCGRQAFNDDEIARRGRHVLLLGLLLAAIMSGVFWMLGHEIIAALGGNANAGFRGSPGQAKLAFIGFGSLLAVGTTMAVSGLLMIAGRSSRVTTCTGIALFAASLVAIAMLLISAYG